MRRPIFVVAALALAIPTVPAAAKQPPPGRTIALTVHGVPKAAKAKIVVKGPTDKSIKTRGNRILRRLKPGTYRIVPRKFTTPAGTWTGKARPKKGKVSKHKGLRVKVTYSKTNPAQSPVAEPPEPPATPFPEALAPSSIALISKNATGVPGDKASVDPTWSPDGQSVAFSSCATNLGGTPDTFCYLYRAQATDGAVARIPNTRMTDIYNGGGEPAWSPDGTRLAFTTTQKLVGGDTDTNKDVYVVSATGTSPQRVSQTTAGANMAGSPAIAEDPQWSPDSTRVMFRAWATNLATGVGNIYIKTLAGAAVARTGTGERTEGARWSSDGRIAFTAGSDYFDPATLAFVRTYDVFTATGDGGSIAAVTTDHGAMGPPSWAPGGSSIAFSTITPLLTSDTNEARDIYATGNPVLRISTAPGGVESVWDATDPVWSPDGQKVAYVASSNGPSTVIVKNLMTGTITQLADPTQGSYCASYDYDDESGETYCSQVGYYGASDPAWSPDSTRIAFTANYPGLVPGDTNSMSDVFVATL